MLYVLVPSRQASCQLVARVCHSRESLLRFWHACDRATVWTFAVVAVKSAYPNRYRVATSARTTSVFHLPRLPTCPNPPQLDMRAIDDPLDLPCVIFSSRVLCVRLSRAVRGNNLQPIPVDTVVVSVFVLRGRSFRRPFRVVNVHHARRTRPPIRIPRCTLSSFGQAAWWNVIIVYAAAILSERWGCVFSWFDCCDVCVVVRLLCQFLPLESVRRGAATQPTL